ncbi:DUF1565 domain-containing protein [Desulfococcaceae bacterium HSG7]|nr:DUF1565 domain-containing protein [Desulfococcaceae bacterium HSG7]
MRKFQVPYTDLQTALAAATSGEQIWVASGTYRRTTGSDRYATFQLINEVRIYGGFQGNENPDTFNLDDRDFDTHETILSGDVGSHGNNNDNSYHVTTASGTDRTAILDGFTITDGGNINYDSGGGMYIIEGSPALNNIIFQNNSAGRNGGGLCSDGGNPTLNDITFLNNAAGRRDRRRILQ